MDEMLDEPWGTVGPSFTAKLPPDVIVGKTLVDAQQEYVPMRVVNLSGQPRTICQGTEVAGCEPVESVIHQQHDVTPDSQVIGYDLPEHLKDLNRANVFLKFTCFCPHDFELGALFSWVAKQGPGCFWAFQLSGSL